jgi:acyl-CoA synthetase (AMP-forming)/AMP-acid ligase II
MVPVAPPPLSFRGRHWSSDELTGMALGWRGVLGERFCAGTAPTALLMTNDPEAVALFFALSSLPAPLIVVPPDLARWRCAPDVFEGARLVLPPRLASRRDDAEQAGLTVSILPEASEAARERAGRGDPGFFTAPSVAIFTSGSTDLPRPVCRPLRTILAGAAVLAGALAFPPGAGVICALPLGRSHGLTHGLLVATAVGCPLALLERFDHNLVLALFASGEYHYWPATPVMADVISRAPSTAPASAPAMCVFPGRLPAHVCAAFQRRFGVPLRQMYGATEAGAMTIDAAPAASVRPDTAGRPLPRVRLCVGDHPASPFAPGRPGRIWVQTPWWMDGYGLPPRTIARESVDGWWPTPDVGQIDEGGALTLAGRVDDCYKTAAGYLVNPALVAAALESLPGVTEAVVVPLDTPAGPALGALVEGAAGSVELRGHLARALPPWSQPRILEPIGALPRLTGGKVDRRACIDVLRAAFARDGVPS